MYLWRSELSYGGLVNFVMGLDLGTDGALLNGFREFLVLKLDGGDNLGWPGLVKHLSGDGTEAAVDQIGPGQAGVDCLFDLLDEFLAEASNPHRRTRIHHEYVQWLQRQSWYNQDLARFSSSPPPEMLDVDQACAMSGVDRPTLFDLVAAGQLQLSRAGAEVLFYRREVEQLVP
ncbi:hypothetical protein GCM10010452_00960 [Crossiella cryophila]